MNVSTLEIRSNLQQLYSDILTPQVLMALAVLAPLDQERKAVMTARTERRGARARDKHRIAFLDPQSFVPRTRIRVSDARRGAFVGSEIPADLSRQWIQGTGPAAKPNTPVERSIRN